MHSGENKPLFYLATKLNYCLFFFMLSALPLFQYSVHCSYSTHTWCFHLFRMSMSLFAFLARTIATRRRKHAGACVVLPAQNWLRKGLRATQVLKHTLCDPWGAYVQLHPPIIPSCIVDTRSNHSLRSMANT